jgi:iron complex outermembrane receptor protein
MRAYPKLLKLSASTCALSLAGALAGGAAFGQTSTPAVETVVVTGSSIRGISPVGSSLITMDQQQLQHTGGQDVTQMLADVPSIEGFGDSGRAAASSSNGGPGIAIYIHQLGANGSGSTLVLVDGHRVVESGVTNYFVDPNTIPSNMIQRVDVLAEGASAVYGSDAVAGVVNFITRKNYEGIQLSGQGSFSNGTSTWQGGALFGHQWDGGGFVVGATYQAGSQLKNTSRPFTNPLAQPARATAEGLTGPNSTNFGNFNCDPATIQANGAGNIYLSAQSATNVVNTPANQICSNWQYGALLPSQVRENSMIKLTQRIGSNLTFGMDVVLDERTSQQIQSRGTITATVYGAGPQANPFYTNPPGVTATRQTIRYDFDSLYGPGALSTGGDDTFWGDASLSYNVDDNWIVDFMGVVGRDDAYAGNNFGLVSPASAFLALNGTAQTGGSTTATDIPGQNVVSLNLPLTTSNALDVWNPAATNRTSPTVLKSLINNENTNHGIYSIVDLKLMAQGSPVSLPAGDVKLAFGMEQLNTHIDEFGTKVGSAAGANVDSLYFNYPFSRMDTAEFVEADFPLVDQAMNVPLVDKFELNLALRHDDYSDFGPTTNYKASFNWDVIEGVRLRANMSTSFVAPPLNLVGGKLGLANFSNVAGATGGGSIPVQYYPQVTQFGIAGCTAASVTCSITSLQGISRSIGDPNATSQKGRGYSVGVDLTPDFLPGFFGALTYWNVELAGGMTGPPFGIITTNATLINNLTLYPACAPQSAITNWSTSLGGAPIPQTSSFPSCVQFTYEGLTTNYLYLYVDGIDAQLNYQFDTDFGRFTIGDNLTQTLKFDDAFSYKTTPTPDQIFSTLNSDGLNTAFPTLATSMRAHLGWDYEGISAGLYMNYSGAYRNVGSPVNPIVNNAHNVWSGVGGDHVKANVTFDLHLGYDMTDLLPGQQQFTLVVSNLFDKTPPYFNSSSGYDNTVANPIGRTITVGFKQNF